MAPRTGDATRKVCWSGNESIRSYRETNLRRRILIEREGKDGVGRDVLRLRGKERRRVPRKKMTALQW